MKRALVTGAGGFIGHHLVNSLKRDGYWVRGVDLHYPLFEATKADDFRTLDLRDAINCRLAVNLSDGAVFDEVYQLAADMGGMGFISTSECEIMRNSALINIHMLHEAEAADCKRYFFSSSVCVYPDMAIGAPPVTEDGAYPAHPHNEYGWEKIYSERMGLAYERNHGMPVRIARFQNTYGPLGTWEGGREKAPAALSRKIAQADDVDTIEIWGDGTAMRSYTFIDDLVSGIRMLMASDLEGPVNIGSPEYVSVYTLVQTIAETAGKIIGCHRVPGPVGVQSRNFTIDRILETGWYAEYTLAQGIAITYPWVAEQVRRSSGETHGHT